MIELTQHNIRLYAAKHYDNISCMGEKEFLNDFFMASKIDRLLEKKEVSIRKIVNLLVTFCNVFESEASARILFFYSGNQSRLKTLLISLNRFPEHLEYLYPYELDNDLLDILMKEFR